MRSLLVELSRLGDDVGGLRKNETYLITAGNRRQGQVQMPIGEKEFLAFMRGLRYRTEGESRAEAFQNASRVVTGLLERNATPQLEAGPFPVQLDLVLNTAELAALPFEMACGSDGSPMALRETNPIIITRRVRTDSETPRVKWPEQPRILFAWASPHGTIDEVPWRDHLAALTAGLEPWAPTGEFEPVLTVLARASAGGIRLACERSVTASTPFTHVHLLAHGCLVGENEEQHYGLALHAGESDERSPADGEQIADALAPLLGCAVMVTLGACDSANTANTVIPPSSVAHLLHVAGFPIVLASMFPLSFAGSTVIAREFYARVLGSRDVRMAVHATRLALANQPETQHDWASLSVYASLPEEYLDQLRQARLRSVLYSLKAVQKAAGQWIENGEGDPGHLPSLLQGRTSELRESLSESVGLSRELIEENYGLLGSSFKRMAELQWRLGDRAAAKVSLQDALAWYRKGAAKDIQNHWTAVQTLSLEAVLAGSIRSVDLWRLHVHVTQALASAEIEEKPRLWAFGSRAELCLLAPAAGLEDDLANGTEPLRKLRQGAPKVDPFLIESTLCQLRRYTDWWTAANGFFPDHDDLSERARLLIDALEPKPAKAPEN